MPTPRWSYVSKRLRELETAESVMRRSAVKPKSVDVNSISESPPPPSEATSRWSKVSPPLNERHICTPAPPGAVTKMSPECVTSMLGSPKFDSFATGLASQAKPFDFDRTGAGPAMAAGAVNETEPLYVD